MDQTAWIAYTTGIGIVAAYSIYQLFRTSKLFEELDAMLEEHMRSWSGRRTGRFRTNSRGRDIRFRRLYYAYSRLDPEALASVRFLLMQEKGKLSYVHGLFGLFLKCLIPALAFALGWAVSDPEGASTAVFAPETLSRLLHSGTFAIAAALVLTLLGLAALQLLFQTYRVNKSQAHLLLIDQVRCDRSMPPWQAETEQVETGQADAKEQPNDDADGAERSERAERRETEEP